MLLHNGHIRYIDLDHSDKMGHNLFRMASLYIHTFDAEVPTHPLCYEFHNHHYYNHTLYNTTYAFLKCGQALLFEHLSHHCSQYLQSLDDQSPYYMNVQFYRQFQQYMYHMFELVPSTRYNKLKAQKYLAI